VEFLRRHRWRLAVALAGYGLLALGALVWPIGTYGPSQSFREGALLAGAGWWITFLLSLDGATAIRMGGHAEDWTSTGLRRLRRAGWRVIDHVPFEHRDVDHVAVGPHGMIAVETKYTSSPWGVGRAALTGPVRDPLGQARLGARCIRLLLKSEGIEVNVVPALAVWGRGREPSSVAW